MTKPTIHGCSSEITFTASLCAHFCSKPTAQHQTEVKHILINLRGTILHRLLFKRDRLKEIITEILRCMLNEVETLMIVNAHLATCFLNW